MVRARARPTRCCIPPESWYGYFFSNPVMPTSSMYRSARSSRSSLLDSIHLQAVGDIVLNGHPWEQSKVLEHHCDIWMRTRHYLVLDTNLAGAEGNQPINTSQQGGLATSRRPHDAQNLVLVIHPG